jgi:deoxynucleoside triphosphate triphosphohydrolase SAMHD1
MPRDEILRLIQTFAEAFAAERLNSYTERIRKPGVIRTSPKEINDPIWGTVKLSPIEVSS